MEIRSKWSDGFKEAGLDAVIYPALPLVAAHHGIASKLTASFSYFFIANLLNWPCGTIPVTTVRDEEQSYQEEPKDEFSKLANYVMEKSAGLPMSVSVMTPAFRDEQCLRVMKEVERVTRFKTKPKAFRN